MDYLENKSIWEIYSDLFRTACRKQDYERAQTILDNAFIEAEGRRELDNRMLWCIYSLASCYLSTGHEEKAKMLYEKLNALKDKVVGRNHLKFSDILEQLALLQSKQAS